MRRASTQTGSARIDTYGSAEVYRRGVESYAGASVRLSGNVRRPVQPGGNARRVYLLSLLPNTTRSASRTSSRLPATAILPTIPTPPTCRSATRRTSSRRWIFRTSCRRCTHRERFSMHSLEKSFLTGRLRRHLCARLRRITACLTTRCPPPIRSAATMAI